MKFIEQQFLIRHEVYYALPVLDTILYFIYFEMIMSFRPISLLITFMLGLHVRHVTSSKPQASTNASI